MLAKRTKGEYSRQPYCLNPDIYLYYELPYDNEVIKPGDKIKVKNERGRTFRFRFMAHNIKLDTQWIDCNDDSTGEFRAFHVSKLVKVVKPKRGKQSTRKN